MERNWRSPLIAEIKRQAQPKEITQILVVCGSHDTLKKDFLKKRGFSIASEWFVGRMA